jgi:septum formation protein
VTTSRSIPSLVLASGSPRRADVLRQLGLAPVVRTSEVDETPLPGEAPAAQVERLARSKATAVAADFPGAVVVGGDTVVVDGDRILGKPSDAAEAVRMLVSLSGRTHAVLSGVAVVTETAVVSEVARADVRLGTVDRALAERYVATGEPMDKAGAYGIQGLGAALVDSVEGDYYTVVGFPVGAFLRLLERAGWRYDFGRLTRIPS